MACDVRDIHYVGTFRMNTFGNSRVPQYVRRRMGYPCPLAGDPFDQEMFNDRAQNAQGLHDTHPKSQARQPRYRA